MYTKNQLLLVALLANGGAMAANPANHALPLSFIENQGQAPAAVRYMAKGSGLTAYFSAGEILLRLAGVSVGVGFEGANAAARVEGEYRLPSHANFLTGEKENWRLNVPVYGAVRYRELYPGIDMLYGGQGRELKSEFLVAAGADPLQIRMRYSGAELRITEAGELAITVNGQELREQAPLVYQDRSGKREAIQGRFDLAADGTVGFLIGKYDTSRPLVIDPVLSYSTLLGGSGFDSAMALAVDASGSAYVAGYTSSYDFPTAGAAQNSSAGGNDVFIAKLNPAGNGLVYSTYLGGSGDDRAYGIAVDAGGSVYVTGSTTSSNFPVKGALQSRLAGYRNAFVAKLNAAGNGLVYNTYLGGNASDAGNGIAVDAGGNAYVVGDTTSSNFPANGFQGVSHGGQEVFVSKLNSYGSQLVWSTYLGGYNDDHGAAIAVDGSGSAYVTGSTWSNNFPVANAAQGTLAGGQDAFVARLSADGKALLFSTYLGGSSGTIAYPEAGQGIALDSQGNAYVTGVTSSANLPTLHPLQATLHGWTDAFVTKMSASGALVYSTYLGGSGVDTGNAVAVDSTGSAYVVGYTYSNNLPVTNALQGITGGDYDAFVARLAVTGDSLLYLSYLGGNNSDTATAVALDTAGNVHVAGWTLSSNFPVLNAYQSVNAGNYGAFVAKLTFNLPPTVVGVTPNSGSGASQTFSLQFSNYSGASNLTSVSVLFNSTLSTANTCSVIYNLAQNTLALLTDTGAQPASTITPGSGSQQNSQCVLNGAGSSVSTAGTQLTLNLAFTFLQAFNGTKNIYMQAISPFGSSSWQSQGSWTVTAVPSALVAFVKTDAATLGTWKGTYGANGSAIAGDSTNYPSYAQVSFANQNTALWAASTADVRALQKFATAGRLAATWWSWTNFSMDVNFTDGNTHEVALYCLDWDYNGRSEVIDVLDAASGNVLDSRGVSGFSNGQYLVWNISGHVKFRVTPLYGNAVVSGIFFGGALPSSASGAAFVKTDTATLGTWKGTYGTNGSAIAGDSTNYPSYAQVSFANQNSAVWAASTADVRALQEFATAGRLAATWWSWTNFSINVNFTDGNTHQVALYCLDWDHNGRSEVIDVLDAASGNVLDSRGVSGFSNGQYLVWNIGGHVKFRVTPLYGNAVVSGIFFGGALPSSASGAAFVKTDTTTQGTWEGTYGANGSAIAGDSTNYPSYAQVSFANQNTAVWAASTTDVRALQEFATAGQLAATWWSWTNFSIDVNFTDGNTHQVALYCLDWDYNGRSEVIDVLNAASGNVLDSRGISGFSNGQYLVWNISGHVTFRVTPLYGNAVVSGVFFN